MSNNLKEFKLDTREDYIIYLNYLMLLAKRQLYYFKAFQKEIKKTIDSDEEYISDFIYETNRNRISFIAVFYLICLEMKVSRLSHIENLERN